MGVTYKTDFRCKKCGEEFSTDWCKTRLGRWIKKNKLMIEHINKHKNNNQIKLNLEVVKMDRAINKNDIDQMLDNGYSIEEIAENQGSDECVQKVLEIDFPSWCGENAECHDCWVKCLEEYVKEDTNTSEKWTYDIDINRDIWRGEVCNSREEAIKEATEEARIEGIKNFKIGICEEVFNYGIEAEGVLERIGEIVYDEVGEVAEDYLRYVSKEHKEELQDKLNEVFYAWQEKYNYKPNFYTIISEEVIVIE